VVSQLLLPLLLSHHRPLPAPLHLPLLLQQLAPRCYHHLAAAAAAASTAAAQLAAALPAAAGIGGAPATQQQPLYWPSIAAYGLMQPYHQSHTQQ
jgi:hypothetical protein